PHPSRNRGPGRDSSTIVALSQRGDFMAFPLRGSSGTAVAFSVSRQGVGPGPAGGKARTGHGPSSDGGGLAGTARDGEGGISDGLPAPSSSKPCARCGPGARRAAMRARRQILRLGCLGFVAFAALACSYTATIPRYSPSRSSIVPDSGPVAVYLFAEKRGGDRSTRIGGVYQPLGEPIRRLHGSEPVVFHRDTGVRGGTESEWCRRGGFDPDAVCGDEPGERGACGGDGRGADAVDRSEAEAGNRGPILHGVSLRLYRRVSCPHPGLYA